MSYATKYPWIKNERKIVWIIKKKIAMIIFINLLLISAINMKKDNDIRAKRGIDKNVPVRVGIKRFTKENKVREINAVFLERFLIIK